MSANEYSPLLANIQTTNPSQSGITRTITTVGIATAIASVSLVVLFMTVISERPYHIAKATLRQSRSIDITTPQGSLRGYVLSSRQGRDYYVFYKVPYAQPPTGSLRFKDPQPAGKWSGIRDIKENAPECMQKHDNKEFSTGEEDCLYAHIYTPSIPTNGTKHPVMVYIHGGWHLLGRGSRYGAEYMMDEDVVLVTFQHRLGTLGFLNNEDGVFTGNQGFKDQVMMLQWVQDNIDSYGGDPSHVTIFGNSAGATAVGFHMVSPMSAGLFHGAITQSCTALCMRKLFSRTKATDTVKTVAAAMNCSYTTDSQALLLCLQSKPAADVASVPIDTINYTITIDDKFLPQTPYQILAAGKANPVPYIIGITNAESIGGALNILYSDDRLSLINRNFSAGVRKAVYGDFSEEEFEKMHKYYFQDKSIGNETLWNITNLVSDWDVAHCSHVAALLHSRTGPTFTYYLTKVAEMSYVNVEFPEFPVKQFGIVSHADEVQYLFTDNKYPYISATNDEYFHFSSYMVRLWVHFARTGNPTLNEVQWSSWNWKTNKTFWFNLNDQSEETHEIDERMKFWDQFSHKQLLYDA